FDPPQRPPVIASLANARRGNLPKFQAQQLKQNSFYCIKEIATVCLRNNAMTGIEFRLPETKAVSPKSLA
ncbi:MAG: hypothetical protein IKN18_00725, partial [Neisseriaceae bacterium]|nr:hypothetical protein [Neisseriaceae bacterium]